MLIPLHQTIDTGHKVPTCVTWCRLPALAGSLDSISLEISSNPCSSVLLWKHHHDTLCFTQHSAIRVQNFRCSISWVLNFCRAARWKPLRSGESLHPASMQVTFEVQVYICINDNFIFFVIFFSFCFWLFKKQKKIKKKRSSASFVIP